MDYYVELDIFQGPLDLLLDLLEQQEIDVYSVQVSEITARYWEVLQLAGATDLEDMEEFLLWGAELLALKARLLLWEPEENPKGEELKEEEASLELSRRLQAYQQYRRAAEKLAALEKKASLSFGRPLETEVVARALARVDPLAGITLSDLEATFRKVIQHYQAAQETNHPAYSVARRSITLLEQQRLILRMLARVQGRIKFRAFLKPQPSRLEVATTFLALLELVRQGRVQVYQPETFGEIEVCRKE